LGRRRRKREELKAISEEREPTPIPSTDELQRP